MWKSTLNWNISQLIEHKVDWCRDSHFPQCSDMSSYTSQQQDLHGANAGDTDAHWVNTL